MPSQPTAAELIGLLGLAPLPDEGGHYAETWSGAPLTMPSGKVRRHGSAIYYLVTPAGFSAMHRLPTDEVYHFYLGDPVEQLILMPGGSGHVQVLGTDFIAGQRPQSIAPAGSWQGSRLLPGGPAGYALIGTTMAPGFHFEDYEHGDRDDLTARYPQWREAIMALTREPDDALV
ncbi:MAG: cupin domain-containing protein, partial [Thermomicrobiales bacterium]